LIDEMLGEEADEDAFDEASDVVFEVIDDLVARGEIKDMPDNGVPVEQQQEWLTVSIPVIKEALKEALHDGFVGEE
jgi:hypothetical protein